MSIWKTSSIKETPEIKLVGWKIYEVSSPYWLEVGRTRHFSGYNLTEMEGRVSSAILEFDKDKMLGKTRSGRIYSISDKAITMSQTGDANYVWSYYIQANKLFDIQDVTGEYNE